MKFTVCCYSVDLLLNRFHTNIFHQLSCHWCSLFALSLLLTFRVLNWRQLFDEKFTCKILTFREAKKCRFRNHRARSRLIYFIGFCFDFTCADLSKFPRDCKGVKWILLTSVAHVQSVLPFHSWSWCDLFSICGITFRKIKMLLLIYDNLFLPHNAIRVFNILILCNKSFSISIRLQHLCSFHAQLLSAIYGKKCNLRICGLPNELRNWWHKNSQGTRQV